MSTICTLGLDPGGSRCLEVAYMSVGEMDRYYLCLARVVLGQDVGIAESEQQVEVVGSDSAVVRPMAFLLS
ncbi:hypothetical protein NUU61_003536 [Penicillium alfredii]|uniref:Uncharacterized protein n=1 Tax=Penicillium alfredii TaxID=1506179 RepID=A0A9W9FJL3_9EURO|nr:uncharacterized protein NUU61_003536 [Penicillium alfredii]KAJ5101314.1 hypothetical protein NUU61_003536 [Penicillium alfredii]